MTTNIEHPARASSRKRLRFVQLAPLVAIAALSCLAANAEPCKSPAPKAPLFVTGDCVDPRFNEPYVDIDEQRTAPVPHRYIHGGFKGTDLKFAFYFPPKEQYQGRFFQNTHQLLSSENAQPDTIGFAIASGGYYVQSNLGGRERSTNTEQAVNGNLDSTIGGYRANAEAAKFSRIKAVEIYGGSRPYGYLYGGSGGAYQTISSAQNTKGVWDGFVPFVMGTPNAIPSMFTVRIHALRVLKNRNKFPEIMDAIDPGGSGNPYAGLDAEEAAALREADRMGYPMRGWWNHATLTGGPLRLVAGYVPLLDPTYTDDFWSKPGYLGTDAKSSIKSARIQHATTVLAVTAGAPARIELKDVPAGDVVGADLVIMSGAAAGKSIPVGSASGKTVSVGFGAQPEVVKALQANDTVRIDNSAYLALQTYHRHQVPTPDMYAWNQFRGSEGKPLYPQRDVLIGPIGTLNGGGSIPDGRFNGKMIVMETLIDIDALPWQADWYHTKVKEVHGKDLENKYRLYYIDHAQHVSPSGTAAFARTISYQGALQQTLRDLSAWVERGVPAPASTNYRVVDSQVLVPESAAQRAGIQPVVHLQVNGGERADVKVGQSVDFSASVEMPIKTGRIVTAEWDFEGVGNFPVVDQLSQAGQKVELKKTHAFSKPGTYFPVLRTSSQQASDAATPYARVQNLGRVRVVVK